MIYTVKVFKSWAARDAERRWSNTYEVESAALAPSGLGALVAGIVAAEKLIHINWVQFLSATVSTWEADGAEYNPLSFTTIDLAGTGARNGTVIESLDSNVTYVMRFIVGLGRNGRRFYRGCLTETDIESGGDLRATLAVGSQLAAAGATFVAYKAAMAPYIAGGASDDTLVLAGANAVGVAREVVNILPGGVSINKRNHRYYDIA